ncbi:MAG: hypothetical protein LBS18_05520 [Clostridiales bacterium]|jgi:hypothetical protein|nr:hypothetical protein [Clostridiales bacterium]
MAIKHWKMEEFSGIDQSRDGSLCRVETSPYAYNMDTADGNLSVAKGYVKHLTAPVPGSGIVRRFRVMPLMSTFVYAAIAGDDEGRMNLYAYDTEGGAWHSVYRYPEHVTGRRWDMLQCNIGDYDYLLIACGEHQTVKWDGISAQASLFGSGETKFTGAVQTCSGRTLTLAAAFSEETGKEIKRKGLIINGATQAVEDVDHTANTVTLKTAPATPPAAGTAVTVRGGVSDAAVNYLALHYGRLFCAGDPTHPGRVYYSQIAGDGRSIEDWHSDESSANAGGGLLEIGDSVGDPIMGLVSLSTQLLIIKRYSIYRLLGDRPSNYTVERVDAEVEQMAHTSVATHADVAFYLTPAGLCYFNNITVQPMPDARSLFRFMKGCYVGTSKACEAKDCLYFTCYKGDDPQNRVYDNHMIVYDIRRRTYMLRRGFEAADLFALDGSIYMLGGDRYVYRFNEGPDYDGRPIRAHWETQTTDLFARAVEKKIDEVFLRGTREEGDKAGAAVLLTTKFGGRGHVFRALMKDDPEEIIEIRPDSDWARTFQFEIDNEAGSRFSLQGGMEIYMQVQERPR